MNYAVSLLILILPGIVLGYLFGSLVWSIIIGKLFFKKDPRDYESHNAGATNSSRIYGKKVALIILLLDISKGLLPTIIMWLIAKYALDFTNHINDSFNPYTLSYLAGLFAIIGHCYPVFFKFKGGKGVATFGAFLITIMPFGALWQLIIMIGIVLISKYVSLGSLLSSLMSPIWMFIPGLNYNFVLNSNINEVYYLENGSIYWLLFILCILTIAIVLVWVKHRKNIVSLINHSERKFKFK